MEFDNRTSIEQGKQTLGEHKRNLMLIRTQEKAAVTPQKSEADLHVSVQESLAGVWVDRGLLWHQGR